MTSVRTFLLALVLVAMLACDRVDIPAEPTPASAQLERVTFVSQLDAHGEALFVVPESRGVALELPSVTCLVSADGEVWQVVASAAAGPTCVVMRGPDGNLNVWLRRGTPGWWAFFAVLYAVDGAR